MGVAAGCPSVSNLDEEARIVEVYWRPGCPFCASLRRDLNRRGIPSHWHNIWTDDAARKFVQSVNNGNETVPTVRVGAQTLSNPSGAQVAALLPGSADRDQLTAHRRFRWGWSRRQ